FVTASATGASLTSGVNDGTPNNGDGIVVISWAAPAQVTPALVSKPSASVAPGGTIADVATLTGGSAPTGTITFRLYGPGDTTCSNALATSTETVLDNGSYVSAAFTAVTAGTYQWVASYGGDTANRSTAGACGGASVQVGGTGGGGGDG